MRRPARRVRFRSPDEALKSAGAFITSAARTPEHNAKVGGVKNSYHLTTRGGRARDIRKSPGMTAAKIRAAMRGYDIIELIDEGDHFHVAWR